jgi:hypothetical protein
MLARMRNPWLDVDLGSDELVHPSDRAGILAFNNRVAPEYRLRLELVPQPYMGNPRNCRLLLLHGNPGFHEPDLAQHQTSVFRAAARASLRHEAREYQFLLLRPAFEGFEGGVYWRRVLRFVFDAVASRAHVAREQAVKLVAGRVALVELHAYHSQKLTMHASLRGLPTRAYTRELIRRAHRRGASCLVMRSAREWQHLLGEAPSGWRLRNPRNASVSPGNLPPGAFDSLVASLV